MACVDAGYVDAGKEHLVDNAKVEWEYWLYGVTNVSIATIGIFLNLLGIIVLFKNKDLPLFLNLMLSLFCIDVLFLVATILTQLQINIGGYSSFISYMYPYFSHPLQSISIYASVWMTIFMSFERYQALKNPVEYRQRSARPRFQKRRLCIYLCSIMTIAVVFNIPTFMEYELVYVDKEILELFVDMKYRTLQPGDDICELNNQNECVLIDDGQEREFLPFVRYTELQDNNEEFINYATWSRFVLQAVLPMILIIYLNGNTFYFMNREKKSIRTALDGRDNETEKKVKTRELKMARTFLAIILAFIICYIPIYISATIDALRKIDTLCPTGGFIINSPVCCYIYQLWYYIIFYFGNVLITLNSSINVLLYGFTGKKFRSDAKKILCVPFTSSKCFSLPKLTSSNSIFRTFSNAKDTQSTNVPAISRDPNGVT